VHFIGGQLLGSGKNASEYEGPAVYAKVVTKHDAGGNSSPPFQLVVLRNIGSRNAFTVKNALQLLEWANMTT